MTPREHARLARSLIEACGGLEEASLACRVSKSKLSAYQTPHDPLFMAADVIADLEIYCGRPIYSSALAGRFDPPRATGDLRDAACDFAEKAMDVQRVAREAEADGEWSASEIERLAREEREAADALERIRALRRNAEQRLQPRLKAV
ncbi:hypothetical protein ACO2Q0_02775 [Phenylobacterium sp. VNQ135]|uniref:hypothetical protein n=1 Tax=Phenylobacterium sp. VNQ135 TaxID=3400922 RepID=UPI003BFAF310